VVKVGPGSWSEGERGLEWTLGHWDQGPTERFSQLHAPSEEGGRLAKKDTDDPGRATLRMAERDAGEASVR
jgi:hypothetical protein